MTIDKLKDLLKASLLNIETDNSITTDEKVKTVIHSTSIICATIAIQPIPFADAFILTPIQAIMVTKLTHIIVNDYKKKESINNQDIGYEKTNIKSDEILKTIVSSVGTGFLVQQGVIGLYKTIIPFLGAITTIPLVYGATFAMGRTAQWIIERRLKGESIDRSSIREFHKEIAKEKENEVKKEKNLNEYLNAQNKEIEKRAVDLEGKNQSLEKQVTKLQGELQDYLNKWESRTNNFENSIGGSKLILNSKELHEKIIELIKGAKKSIFLLVFNISEYDILDALVAKSYENLEIQVLVNYGFVRDLFNGNSATSSSGYSYSPRTVNKILNCFEQPNIEVRVWGRNVTGGIMHKKDLLVDEQYLLSGSANFTRNGTSSNKETAIFITDTNLVNEMYDDSLKLFKSRETEAFDRDNFI